MGGFGDRVKYCSFNKLGKELEGLFDFSIGREEVRTMKGNQYPVTIHLLVKATSKEEALSKAVSRINDWFLDPKQQDCVEGYGYPDGALIHYSIEKPY